MAATGRVRGIIYRCPVCGAELIVVGDQMGAFEPRCCNRPMNAIRRRAVFYRCPVCGAEVAVVRQGKGTLDPRCCNREMTLLAA